MLNNIINLSFKGKTRECFAGQLIIKVQPDTKSEAIPTLLRILGNKTPFKIIEPFDENGIGLIDIGEANLEEVAKTLEENQEIIYAEPNDVTRISSTPTITPADPLFSQEWHLLTIQAPAAWSISQGANDVVISVIDSGIPMMGTPPVLSHEDLSNTNRFFLGTNYVIPGTPPLDDHGHGTHVAGIAAAESNNSKGIAGINWKCRVFICKVFSAQGAGSNFSLYKAVQESIAFAKSNNWRLVINYSGQSRTYSAIMEDIAKAVQESNTLLCAAAGNDTSTVGYPAALSTLETGAVWYPNIIAVSATTRGDDIASFSNRGIQINVAAPGVDILSTLPNYEVTLNKPPSNKQQNYDTLNGTSMATPIVSGLAALIWSVFPTLSATQVREKLQSTALDLSPAGKDPFFGFGRINAFAALTAPVTTPNPPINPWDDPSIRGWMDEWIRQADRCLKKKFPGAYIDKWGRGCGNFGNTTVSCNNNPAPPGWHPYRYLWAINASAEFYLYRLIEYVQKRQAGNSFSSLAKCK